MIVLAALSAVTFAAWWGVATFAAPDHLEPLPPDQPRHVRLLDDGVEWGGRNP